MIAKEVLGLLDHNLLTIFSILEEFCCTKSRLVTQRYRGNEGSTSGAKTSAGQRFTQRLIILLAARFFTRASTSEMSSNYIRRLHLSYNTVFTYENQPRWVFHQIIIQLVTRFLRGVPKYGLHCYLTCSDYHPGDVKGFPYRLDLLLLSRHDRNYLAGTKVIQTDDSSRILFKASTSGEKSGLLAFIVKWRKQLSMITTLFNGIWIARNSYGQVWRQIEKDLKKNVFPITEPGFKIQSELPIYIQLNFTPDIRSVVRLIAWTEETMTKIQFGWLKWTIKHTKKSKI